MLFEEVLRSYKDITMKNNLFRLQTLVFVMPLQFLFSASVQFNIDMFYKVFFELINMFCSSFHINSDFYSYNYVVGENVPIAGYIYLILFYILSQH